jgi:hypothetical protein
MDINNIDRAVKIKNRIMHARVAAKDLEELIKKYKAGDSDGGFSDPKRPELYGFYFHEHSDGSGSEVDLTGLLVGTTLLKGARIQVLEQIKVDLEEIKAL